MPCHELYDNGSGRDAVLHHLLLVCPAETSATPSSAMSFPATLALKRPSDYSVAVELLGSLEQLVRLLEHYAVDEEATARLRMR
jgi:hypothetical protein